MLVTKLSSWQAFAICLIGLVGYMGIKFYEKQTERMIATAQVSQPQKGKLTTETSDTAPAEGLKPEHDTKVIRE